MTTGAHTVQYQLVGGRRYAIYVRDDYYDLAEVSTR
jgi:hypothetical protein